MYTTFAFLTGAQHLTTEEFIDYYENHLVLLINRPAGPVNQPLVYKRRYAHRDDPAHVAVKASFDSQGHSIAAPKLDSMMPSPVSLESFRTNPGSVDFDVITEIGFEDREGMEKWMVAVGTGENGRMVGEDGERFLWKERTRAVVAEERVSFG